MKITLEHLHRACEDQRELFAKTFPDGAPLTQESIERAVRAGLDVLWLTQLLDGSAWEQYKALVRPAWEQYEALVRPAWEQYEAVERPAWEQYMAVQRQAREQYMAVQRQAREQYMAVQRPAWEQYKAVQRQAFLAALQMQFGSEK